MSETQSTPQPTTDGDLIDRVESLEDRVCELEAENERLREQVGKHDRDKAAKLTINHLLAALSGADIDDYAADPMQYRNVAEDVQTRLEHVETGLSEQADRLDQFDHGDHGKGSGAWGAIVKEAHRCQGQSGYNLSGNRVQLHTDDIARATGRSERMASNYIEDFGEEKRGADWRPYKPPNSANNGEPKRKRLVVDLDVWGDDDG